MSKSRKPILIAATAGAVAAIVVLGFVMPAETGWDPLGIGKATGLVKIANPDNAELERGMARMENEDVLVLSDSAPTPVEGISDSWEYELAPYESIEFKYTVPQGAQVAFSWSGTDTLNYDMHAHPFEGGEEMTESYGVDEAQAMHGVYTAPWTGIHGWFWENRTLDPVMLRLETTGGMTHSTVFGATGPVERPLEGVENTVEGSAAGHQMQDAE